MAKAAAQKSECTVCVFNAWKALQNEQALKFISVFQTSPILLELMEMTRMSCIKLFQPYNNTTNSMAGK